MSPISKEALKKMWETNHSGQKLEELWWLYDKVNNIKPSVVMEMGIYAGGTLRIWSTLCSKPTDMVIGLDFKLDLWDKYRAASTAQRWDISKSEVPIYILGGNSHLPDTVKNIESILSGRKIDFLFIDGDHSYKGVSLDYEMYSPLVRDGGIIGFHDLSMGKDYEDPEKTQVRGFWKDLKHKKYDFYASIPYGIGYIIKGEK